MKICEFRDGDLCLETIEGAGMEFDLVFAAGATAGDPLLIKQREQMDRIVKCVSCHDELLEALQNLLKATKSIWKDHAVLDGYPEYVFSVCAAEIAINKATGEQP